jgi:hypothetical protein
MWTAIAIGAVNFNAEDFSVWFLVHCLSQSNHSIFGAIDTPSEVFPDPKARFVMHPFTYLLIRCK